MPKRIVCTKCGVPKYDAGIPGYPKLVCLEGCDDLFEILPVVDASVFESQSKRVEAKRD